MKGEEQIIELLIQSLQSQEAIKRDTAEIKERLGRVEQRLDRLEERAERIEARLGTIEERLNRQEWRQDDLSLKNEDLRYHLIKIDKQVAAVHTVVTDLLKLNIHLEGRVRQLENPGHQPGNALAA